MLLYLTREDGVGSGEREGARERPFVQSVVQDESWDGGEQRLLGELLRKVWG